MKAYRASFLIESVAKTDGRDDVHAFSSPISINTPSSGSGSKTYEICTLAILLDMASATVATAGTYSDTITFTLSTEG